MREFKHLRQTACTITETISAGTVRVPTQILMINASKNALLASPSPHILETMSASHAIRSAKLAQGPLIQNVLNAAIHKVFFSTILQPPVIETARLDITLTPLADNATDAR